MCLYCIKRAPEKIPTIGYKVFIRHAGFCEVDTYYTGPYYGEPMLMGMFYSAVREKKMTETMGDWYMTGFHVFYNIPSARLYMNDIRPGANESVCICKVDVEGVRCFGEQSVLGYDTVDCFICDKIKILREVR